MYREANAHDMPKTEVGDMLRAHGLRRTAGRMKVLSVLMGSRRPLSHAMVHERVGAAAMDRVSVYRALEAFVEAGFVHRAFIDDRTSVFELSDRCTDRQCHPHFLCRECGKVTCMTEVNMPLAKGLPEGYRIERQKVFIEGTCAACGARKQKDGST